MYKKKMITVLLLMLISINTACSSGSEGDMLNDTIIEDEVEKIVETEVGNKELISSKPLARSDYVFTSSKNGQVIRDEIDEMIPGFMDIISFRKEIDNEKITVYLEVREIPKNVTIHQNAIKHNMIEYSWRINFDTNGDNMINYDTTINHDFFWKDLKDQMKVSIDDPIFNNIVWQHQVTTGHILTNVSFRIDDNTMIYQVEKGDFEELQQIDEDTPFYVLTEHNSGEHYLYQMIPRK